MSERRRLSTRKILVASVGVAIVAAGGLATGCNHYPVGNLMPPRPMVEDDAGDGSAPVVPVVAPDGDAGKR